MYSLPCACVFCLFTCTHNKHTHPEKSCPLAHLSQTSKISSEKIVQGQEEHAEPIRHPTLHLDTTERVEGRKAMKDHERNGQDSLPNRTLTPTQTTHTNKNYHKLHTHTTHTNDTHKQQLPQTTTTTNNKHKQQPPSTTNYTTHKQYNELNSNQHKCFTIPTQTPNFKHYCF